MPLKKLWKRFVIPGSKTAVVALIASEIGNELHCHLVDVRIRGVAKQHEVGPIDESHRLGLGHLQIGSLDLRVFLQSEKLHFGIVVGIGKNPGHISRRLIETLTKCLRGLGG